MYGGNVGVLFATGADCAERATSLVLGYDPETSPVLFDDLPPPF